MRQFPDIVGFKPLLIGTMEVAAGTAVGDSVDMLGFRDAMVIVQYACVGTTNAETANLEVRFQEGATAAGTGGDMVDITNGMIMGSMKINTAAMTAPTDPSLACTTFYERFGDGTRKRWIRPIATLTGTAGVCIVYSIGIILGRPRATEYIKHAQVYTTAQAEYQLPLIPVAA